MNKEWPQEEARQPEEYLRSNLDKNNMKRPHVYIYMYIYVYIYICLYPGDEGEGEGKKDGEGRESGQQRKTPKLVFP